MKTYTVVIKEDVITLYERGRVRQFIYDLGNNLEEYNYEDLKMSNRLMQWCRKHDKGTLVTSGKLTREVRDALIDAGIHPYTVENL